MWFLAMVDIVLLWHAQPWNGNRKSDALYRTVTFPVTYKSRFSNLLSVIIVCAADARSVSDSLVYLRQMRMYMFCPCLFVCLSVCLFVCEQDYSNTRAWIWMNVAVDRCQNMDELINFWARSREFPNKKWSRVGLNHLLEKMTNMVVLNALPVVVDYGQRVMLKTSSPFVSLCTVKKTAHTAIILSDR